MLRVKKVNMADEYGTVNPIKVVLRGGGRTEEG
jgi:hypothetical protein